MSINNTTSISEPNHSYDLGYFDIHVLLSCCRQECALTEDRNHALVFNVNISRTRHEFSMHTKPSTSHWLLMQEQKAVNRH